MRIGPLEEPFKHHLCRFFREGEGKDLVWIDPMVEEMEDLLGDDPGLPGAGPDEYQLVAVTFHGPFLRGVQDHYLFGWCGRGKRRRENNEVRDIFTTLLFLFFL